MRRRKNRIKYFLILLLVFTFLSVGYALLSTKLSIYGIVTGTDQNNGNIIETHKDFTIEEKNLNKWQEGNNYKYQYNFNIKNISQTGYDNFKVTIIFNDNITAVNTWNYTYEFNNKTLILNNSTYISGGGSKELSLIVTSSNSDLKIVKIKLEINITTTQVSPNDFKAIFKRGNGWGNYIYQYDVTVTNNTGTSITYWQISIDLPVGTNYNSGWNALFNTYENQLVIKNASHNGNLSNGESTSFGLQLGTNILNYVPTNYSAIVR